MSPTKSGIAVVKSQLAGSTFDDPVFFNHGIRFTIRLVPFQHTLADVQRIMPKIASGLEVPMENLIVEQHPLYPKNPTILQFTVITQSPIERTVYFDRPRFINGFIQLGPYADGMGEAFLRLYSENSMWSSFVLGGTGIGKSRLLEQAAISALAMGNTIIFYMDGQGGASSRTLFKYADWAVGIEGAPTMMATLEHAARWRQAELRVDHWGDGGDGFTPSSQRPGIWVIVDEQHRIAPLFGERLGFAVSEWRKVGISFFGADQDSALKTTFANEDRMRAGMLGGNGFAMNVQSRMAGNLIPGLETHPADLPRIPGYAVRVAAADSIDPDGEPARSAPFRNRYAPNAKEKAKAQSKGIEVPVPTIEEWFERYPMPEMDRGTARSMGDDYRYRHEAHRETLDKMHALVNASDEEYADVVAAMASGRRTRVPSQRLPIPALGPFAALVAASGIPTTGRRVSAREAILALPWGQFPEQDFDLIMDGLRTAGHQHSEAAVRKALQLMRGKELARDGRSQPYRRLT